jgi:gliding motility-associated-like protein
VVISGLPEIGEWTLIRYPGAATSTGTGASTTVTALTAGTYNFAVRNEEGCTSVVSGNAVINPQPVTPSAPVVGTITHPTLTVTTGSVALSGLPSSGTWTLTRLPENVILTGTGTTRTVTGLDPGTYTFTVANAAGCTSLPTGNVTINAVPGAPNLVINNPATICSNQTTDLTAPAVTAGSDENLTYTYWLDAAATLPYATPAAATAGTYYIRGTTTAGYSTTKPVVVTADQLPVAYAGLDQTLDYQFVTTLMADAPLAGTGIWSVLSGTGELFNSAAAITDVNGLSLGRNEFVWTITNGVCPPVSDNVVVTVNDLVIPTLITPNGDNKNDYFVIRGLETLGRTELLIFDRRGLKVYENDNYDNTFEGLDYNGNPVQDDTYFYTLRSASGTSMSGYIVVRR